MEGEDDASPGPICTETLFVNPKAQNEHNPWSCELKPDLIEGKHVAILPLKAGDLLHKWYKGGPKIYRRKSSDGILDLYPSQTLQRVMPTQSFPTTRGAEGLSEAVAEKSGNVSSIRSNGMHVVPPTSNFRKRSRVLQSAKTRDLPHSPSNCHIKPDTVQSPKDVEPCPQRFHSVKRAKIEFSVRKRPDRKAVTTKFNSAPEVGCLGKLESTMNIENTPSSSPKARKKRPIGIHPNGLKRVPSKPNGNCNVSSNGHGNASCNGDDSHQSSSSTVFGPKLPESKVFGPQLPTNGHHSLHRHVYGPAPAPVYHADSKSVDEDSLRRQALVGWREKGGVCGLQNLGNTCFMNTALQCLAHTVELRHYFLSKRFSSDLRPENPLGSKGQVAKAFASLLREMGNKVSHFSADTVTDEASAGPRVNPREFRYIISKFTPHFAGYEQQDCQEFLAYLLDGLHEDTNIAYRSAKTLKPCPDSPPNFTVAWNRHIRRNKSQVVNLFHGMFASSVACPSCRHHSTTYDPFLYLSLPVPKPRRTLPSVRIVVNFVPINANQSIETFITSVRVDRASDEISVKTIRQIASRRLKIPENRLMLTQFHNRSRSAIKRDHHVINVESLDNGKITLYELPPPFNSKYPKQHNGYRYHNGGGKRRDSRGDKDRRETGDHVVVHVSSRKNQGRGDWRRSLTRIMVVPLESESISTRKLKRQIRRYLIRELKGTHSKLEQNAQDLRFDLYGLQKYVRSTDDLKSYGACFPMSDDSRDRYYNRIPFGLAIDMRCDYTTVKLAKENYGQGEETRVMNASDLSSSEFSVPSQGASSDSYHRSETEAKTSILSCFDIFCSPERLGGSDSWKCSNCKTQQRALKKIAIAKLPMILVVHLKRFHYTGYKSGKVDTLVDFPVRGLDLSRYVLCHAEFKGKHLYDLFAVSNHYGSLEYGHYTAYAKTKYGWHDFDDSLVRKLPSESCIPSRASYILFYERRIPEMK